MRFGVCGIEFRNIYKNKLFYMLSCVGESVTDERLLLHLHCFLNIVGGDAD